jgi:hypothetical protein
MYKITSYDIYSKEITRVRSVRQQPGIVKKTIEDVDHWQETLQIRLSKKYDAPIQVFANFRHMATRSLNNRNKTLRIKRLRKR